MLNGSLWLSVCVCAGLLLFALAAARVDPDFVLRISRETINANCQPRSSVVVNGTLPGPLIQLMEGQHAWIRVYNDLEHENTTMHWHGFTQYLSPFADGTPMVSGWPIPPGHYFDYEFQLEAGHIGTYWYHSHVGLQLHTAQGPMIVVPKDDRAPVQYDEEIVMQIGEYYTTSDEVIDQGLANQTLFKWLGDPQAMLVNGRAPGVCNTTRLAPGETCNEPCGMHRQLVRPSTRYRVRVIGATVLSDVVMALEGHNMTLFEVDGTYVEPIQVKSLEVHSGQRFSVLIETPSAPEKQHYYWRLRSAWRPTKVNGVSKWSYDEGDVKEYDLSYLDIPSPAGLNTSVFLPNETFGWIDDQLKEWTHNASASAPAPTPPSDDEVTRTIVLTGQQQTWGPQGGGFQWRINNMSLTETHHGIPMLLEYYQMLADARQPDYTTALANGGLDPRMNLYPARRGEVLDIVIQNQAGQTSGVVEAHPWHLHGRKYWDMASGPGNYTPEAYRAAWEAKGRKAIRRDTSIVYASPGASYIGTKIANGAPGGWRLLRIKVDNPGAWLMHCHIAPHQSMGMAVLFLFAPEDFPTIPAHLIDEFTTFGSVSVPQSPRSWFDK